MKNDNAIRIELPPIPRYAPVLAKSAEVAADLGGLARRENLALQLAVEELFCYLAQVAKADRHIDAHISAGLSGVTARLEFVAPELSLRALNFSAVVNIGAQGEPPQDLGLLIAARMMDRCRLEEKGGGVFRLVAEIDKTYPQASAQAYASPPEPPFTVSAAPAPDALMQAASLAWAFYPAWNCPGSFRTPGKFADLCAEGRYQAVVLADSAARPAGLLCWNKAGDKAVSFSGPFVFTAPRHAAQAARTLTDAFLAAVARRACEIVFSQRATDDLPPDYFEHLGSLNMAYDQTTCRQAVVFRHLREDAGAAVWAHPCLADFLAQQYDRLAMSRDIMPAPPAAPGRREHSLFSTMMDKPRRLAVLVPLLDGADIGRNLVEHVVALRRKDIANILVHLDLSSSWQALIVPGLLEAGFTPRIVLPHAGASDVAVFQHAPTA